MWNAETIDDSGQATVESAVLLGALAVGALAVGWPVIRKLLAAWELHQATVRHVIDLPLP